MERTFLVVGVARVPWIPSLAPGNSGESHYENPQRRCENEIIDGDPKTEFGDSPRPESCRRPGHLLVAAPNGPRTSEATGWADRTLTSAMLLRFPTGFPRSLARPNRRPGDVTGLLAGSYVQRTRCRLDGMCACVLIAVNARMSTFGSCHGHRLCRAPAALPPTRSPGLRPVAPAR